MSGLICINPVGGAICDITQEGNHPEIDEALMSKALNIIRDEHRSIGAILQGMEYFVERIRARKSKIDPHVFSAMIYYLDTFSERYHHPKEDRYLFSALRSRGKDAAAVVADLELEHASEGEALRRLEQCAMRYVEGGDREFPAFAGAVAKYVRDTRAHMEKEENVVFPMAEKLLNASDWQAIDRAFEQNRDPLADAWETRDFEKLFDRIVNLAPPPIGVGPEA